LTWKFLVDIGGSKGTKKVMEPLGTKNMEGLRQVVLLKHNQ